MKIPTSLAAASAFAPGDQRAAYFTRTFAFVCWNLLGTTNAWAEGAGDIEV